MLAIHALSCSLGPRHPDRPTSGHLKPVHLLAKHPYGGYGEVLFSCGDRLSSLASFEINVATGEDIQGRFHGPSAEDAQRLLDTIRRGLTRQPAADRSLFSLKVDCNLDPTLPDRLSAANGIAARRSAVIARAQSGRGDAVHMRLHALGDQRV